MKRGTGKIREEGEEEEKKGEVFFLRNEEWENKREEWVKKEKEIGDEKEKKERKRGKEGNNFIEREAEWRTEIKRERWRVREK